MYWFVFTVDKLLIKAIICVHNLFINLLWGNVGNIENFFILLHLQNLN